VIARYSPVNLHGTDPERLMAEDKDGDYVTAADYDDLEALLRELIDIEGPQPGHVMWARKVAETLGTTLETSSKLVTQEHHVVQGENGWEFHRSCGCDRCRQQYHIIAMSQAKTKGDDDGNCTTK
jgi:hypothetical protein